ncbi:YqaE/Pmp3 family membrane protein [Pleurocapsa sp. CCALA 161]|uniref:YqaE/Pmp3 family membrane protein n=1 Tax=Pleurocapsa sp. CCALA 161 TaxID=2107688 RepID=UPI000D06F825|nr:YqaE/Pmp3 family membrane protein [Pleurocapsa sp. CCALA 161]PSB06091.1 YqaE/Pmp3 family membrane protein [Pleurocapsa sp. CCALA 161]
MGIIKVIAAILLPPLGVFLTMGVSQALLINILLTLLGWIPGIIHALWIISKQSEQANVQ